MFADAYAAALRAYRFAGGAWYHDSDIFSGRPTHYQFNSLQAFWPGAAPRAAPPRGRRARGARAAGHSTHGGASTLLHRY